MTMIISKQGQYTNFVWYTGVSRLDGTSGSWSLNYAPADPSPFLSIVWT